MLALMTNLDDLLGAVVFAFEAREAIRGYLAVNACAVGDVIDAHRAASRTRASLKASR